MRIQRVNNNINFKGTFFLMSDSHSRSNYTAGLMTAIEDKIKTPEYKKEKTFLLDNGDFVCDTFTNSTVIDVYKKFKERNPKTDVIMNMGNCEILGNLKQNKSINEKELSDLGIKLLSATCQDKNNYIKPFHLVEDIVDGKKQKILFIGFCEVKLPNLIQDNIDIMKKQLDNILKSENFPKEYDKTILMMHTSKPVAKTVTEYAKEKNYKNVDFVFGGHIHSIEDETINNTRFLYTPPQGKAVYIVKHTKKGFEYPKLSLMPNHYDYSPLKNNPNNINNLDISNPLPIKADYLDIIKRDENYEDLYKVVCEKSPVTLKFRNYYSYDELPKNSEGNVISNTTELGSFIANTIKEKTGCDLSLYMTMDTRETIPSKGKPVLGINVSDAINVDQDVLKFHNVDCKKLKEFFEASFEKQDMGITNPNFLEFSNNFRITRRKDAKQNENKIAQIEYFKNDEWIKLLDKNGEPIDDKKTFSVAITGYVATTKERPGFLVFSNYEDREYTNLKVRSIFKEFLNNKDFCKNPNNSKESVIINV